MFLDRYTAGLYVQFRNGSIQNGLQPYVNWTIWSLDHSKSGDRSGFWILTAVSFYKIFSLADSQISKPRVVVHGGRGVREGRKGVGAVVVVVSGVLSRGNRNIFGPTALKGRRRAETLEDVILAEVVVPVVVTGALELDAELQATADHAGDGRVVQHKIELVGESVARSGKILSGHFSRFRPVIGGADDHNLFVVVQVDNAHSSFDGVLVGHVGAFQANLFVAKVIKELGAAAGLVEQRCNGWTCRWGPKCWQHGWACGRQDWKVEIRSCIAIHVAEFCIFEISEC